MDWIDYRDTIQAQKEKNRFTMLRIHETTFHDSIWDPFGDATLKHTNLKQSGSNEYEVFSDRMVYRNVFVIDSEKQV